MPHTNSQKMAQKAYEKLAGHGIGDEFAGFARGFPSLVHTCGLAQAVAFAMAKKEPHHKEYLQDLCAVLGATGYPALGTAALLGAHLRTCPVAEYIRLSRSALLAASWLKRYTEALTEAKP